MVQTCRPRINWWPGGVPAGDTRGFRPLQRHAWSQAAPEPEEPSNPRAAHVTHSQTTMTSKHVQVFEICYSRAKGEFYHEKCWPLVQAPSGDDAVVLYPNVSLHHCPRPTHTAAPGRPPNAHRGSSRPTHAHQGPRPPNQRTPRRRPPDARTPRRPAAQPTHTAAPAARPMHTVAPLANHKVTRRKNEAEATKDGEGWIESGSTDQASGNM